MPLLISDDALRAAGLSEREAKIETACRWFDDGKLSLGHAARLADMSELEFETELSVCGVPLPVRRGDVGSRCGGIKKLGRW